MKVAAYLRVSTSEQTVENQRMAIERYVNANGWTVTDWYEDEGVSGATDSRLALDRLKANVSRGKYEMVMVYRFDRMARSTAHLLECLDLFRRNGVAFVSISEAIDTSSSVGKMIFSFLAAVSEFERELIRERVITGLERAKACGTVLGRPRVGFDVAKAVAMKRNGVSWAQLAKRMNVSVSTLRRTISPLVKNPEMASAS